MTTHRVKHTYIFSQEIVQHTQAIPDWERRWFSRRFRCDGQVLLPRRLASRADRFGSFGGTLRPRFRPTIPVMLYPNDLGDELASARRQSLGHAWALLKNGGRGAPPIGHHGAGRRQWKRVRASRR
jgi:hypothetical protein